MSPATFQTISLSKGKHSSPEEGACVMELASMLAEERFSDHPDSVCPVIGSFLRAYNDSIGDERRQDLYAYASQIVGTRGTVDVERRRAERLTQWAVQLQEHRWSRYLPISRFRMIGLQRQPSVHAIGAYAVHAISAHTEETHRSALALVDELLSISARVPAAPRAHAVQASSAAPVG